LCNGLFSSGYQKRLACDDLRAGDLILFLNSLNRGAESAADLQQVVSRRDGMTAGVWVELPVAGVGGM
jgi:hypothetical protein